MNLILTVYLFLLGTSLGSFVLAMVDRMYSGKDWVKGRSQCEYCERKLRSLDLVPIISWLYLKGKCRYCSAKLSRIYPITELITGFTFVLSFVYWPIELNSIIPIAMFILWLLATVLMVGLFIFDIRWFLLPNKLVHPLIALGSLWMSLDIYMNGLSVGNVFNYIFAILVGAGVFLILSIASKGKWIGDGDIRLGIAMGLFLGTPLLAWFSIFLASILGLVVSTPLIIKSKAKNRLKLKIPFGPLLIFSLYITVLFGEQIINWYKVNILYL